MKNKVYSQRPEDVADLRRKITAAFAEISIEMLENTWQELAVRYEMCRLRNGGHVEH